VSMRAYLKALYKYDLPFLFLFPSLSRRLSSMPQRCCRGKTLRRTKKQKKWSRLELCQLPALPVASLTAATFARHFSPGLTQLRTF